MSHEPKPTCNAESADQCAGGSTVPIWLVAFAALTFYCGLIYLDHNGGDFNAQVYAPYHDAIQLAAYQPQDHVDPLFKHGAQLYGVTCAVCHQATGLGAPGQCPPLAGSEWVLQKDPSRIIRLPMLGASGPITVKGQDLTPSVSMPALGLSDEDEAAVLTYIRQSWGNKAPSVTVEQVKKVRGQVTDHAATSAADLMKIPVTE